MSFSSSFRSTASGMPEYRAASSSDQRSSSSRSGLNFALSAAWISPSSSRSAYDGSSASFAWAERSGYSSSLNHTRAASSRFSSSSSRSAVSEAIRPDSQVLRSR